MIYLKERAITKGEIIAFLPLITKEFKISFDVMIKTYSKVAQFENVIHLTTDGDKKKYGDRIPGVWFLNKRLYIFTALNNNKNTMFHSSQNFDPGKWIHIEMSQTKDTNSEQVILSFSIMGL